MRLAPELHRRIDRLARRAHRFHRHAHHPLCAAYAGEVVRLGRRTRVCRGCLLSALGAVAGAALGLCLPRSPAARPAALAAALALALPLAAAAVLPRHGARLPKLATRAAPLFAAGALAAAGLRTGGAGVAIAVATLAVALAARAAYRLRAPDRTACLGCPERGAPRACSGFAPIARREAAFSRLAGRWIAAASAPGRILDGNWTGVGAARLLHRAARPPRS